MRESLRFFVFFAEYSVCVKIPDVKAIQLINV